MVKYQKRFKYVHAIQSRVLNRDLRIKNNKIEIDKDAAINIRIFQKSMFFEIQGGESFSINVPKEGNFWAFLHIDAHAKLSFSTTTINPYGNGLFGREFPANPALNELFFNKDISRMFIWNGRAWIESDAIVLGEFDTSGECVNLYTNQSQGGFRKQAFMADRIVFDSSQKAIHVYEPAGYSFLTQREYDTLGFKFLKNIRLDTIIHRSVAATAMDAFTVIVRNNDYTVSPCSTASTTDGIALLLNDVETGEECLILEKGFFYTRDHQWGHPYNTPLYYDINGSLSVIPPDLESSLAVQRVGHVADLNTIYFKPEEKFILDLT